MCERDTFKVFCSQGKKLSYKYKYKIQIRNYKTQNTNMKASTGVQARHFQGFCSRGRFLGRKSFTNLLQEKHFSCKPASVTQICFHFANLAILVATKAFQGKEIYFIFFDAMMAKLALAIFK